MGEPTKLIGHQTVLKQIDELLAAGRLPHALLLHGPRGTGKRLLAEHLAWRLICGGSGPEPDRQNATYHQLLAGSCPDLHILTPDDGKKTTGIKQVRALLSTLQRTADTQRVVIVDSVDDLSEESPHVLLKTLEEPRPGLSFILLSHQLGRVLPTIRSRCWLLRLGTLSTTEQSLIRAANPDWKPAAEDELAVMLRGIASVPSFTNAQAYKKIATLQANQAEMNLPSALTTEAARALVK